MSRQAHKWTLFYSFIVIGVANYAFAGPVKHVVLIGCDGMSPDGIRNADTPVLDTMMKNGSFTLRARGVFPTFSGPNWASMINGAAPEQHGVLSNDWQPGKSKISPAAEGPVKGMFPTVFALIRQQKSDAVTACVYDWDQIGAMIEADMVDEVLNTTGSKGTAKRAARIIVERKPAFTFIHMDDVDHVGHDKGHGTPEYYESVAKTDEYIGEILAAIEQAGIADETAVIVTSDHGGHDKGHGDEIMADLEIPWIISGAGIKKSNELKNAVYTYDSAATVAYLLGVTLHPAWIGRPVTEALTE